MSEPELVERAIAEALKPYRFHVRPGENAHLWLARRCCDALELMPRSDVAEDEVERVARALYEQGIVEREIAPAVARAAIATMRSAQQATSAAI